MSSRKTNNYSYPLNESGQDAAAEREAQRSVQKLNEEAKRTATREGLSPEDPDYLPPMPATIGYSATQKKYVDVENPVKR
ncbi:uncharacterized protein PV06_09838 [Exophiala oligosperma]|uniref:Uncharacterized protein n=1 Tax=Exophiala oligosperma TaxID=215243 RepID=A0A0D2D3J5_9EURO|nr:uncharacterized protein PV06_09838 [Exophiala oligosperma]KIW37853.1 hypothetical protein PV06_09838 [Exophiala oligosperma]